MGRRVAGIITTVTFVAVLIAAIAAYHHEAAHPALFDRSTAPRTKAEHQLEALLATVPRPSGARRSATAPGALQHQLMEIDSPHFIDRDAVWVFPTSFNATIEYVKQHPPPGWLAAPSGNGPGREQTYNYTPAPLTDAAQRKAASKAIEIQRDVAETFTLEIAPRDAHSTYARIDAGVVWHSRRLRSTFAAPSTGVVSITRTTTAGARMAHHTVIVTDRAAVHRIVNDFNALPTSSDELRMSCPASTGTTYRVEFRAAVHASANVVAAVGECGDIAITVGGWTGPSLDSGQFYNDVIEAFS